MRDLNNAVPGGISDHAPISVDLPFADPGLALMTSTARVTFSQGFVAVVPSSVTSPRSVGRQLTQSVEDTLGACSELTERSLEQRLP